MVQKKKPGRPNTITFTIKEEDLKVADGNIKQLLKSRVRSFSKSGAYIPLSEEYEDHEVLVIVLEKEEK